MKAYRSFDFIQKIRLITVPPAQFQFVPRFRSRLTLFRLKLWQAVAGALLALLLASPAYTQSPAPQSSPTPVPNPIANVAQPLRVATRLIKPDAFEEDGQIVGFSIDLGKSILEQLQQLQQSQQSQQSSQSPALQPEQQPALQPALQTELKTYANVAEILNAVGSDQVDLGIAAIAVTSQREQDFDFSHPIATGSLQIAVPAQVPQDPLKQLFTTLFSSNLLNLLGTVALLMLIPAHVVWYFERDKKDGLIESPAYMPGIFEALWWTILTLVAQPDEMPKGLVGRIVALFWLLTGIVFVSYFTAVITTTLTVEELQGNIQQLSDLQERQVAVIADSEVADYLQERGIQAIEYAQPQQAYEAMQAEKVDAIVAPRLLLLYYASHDWQGGVQVVGTPFRSRFYSIVMPKNSPYRKPINQAILQLRENGTYAEIYEKWFDIQPQDE